MILELLLTISLDNKVRPPLFEDFRDPSDQGTTTMIPTEQNNSSPTLSIIATFSFKFMYLLYADPVVEPTNEL